MQFTNIDNFINWVQVQKRFSKKVSLDKMKYYCQLFDNPQDQFKSIHVTGTNGKGSTVAMLKHILMKKGLKIATFTSPYVTCFNERICYNNTYISDEDVLTYANLFLSKYDIIEQSGYELPTFFEFITVLAYLYFASLEDLDFAIIEVGMGGRLDATNVITPILSIITNVAFDHMQVLGNTLEEILTEKLGIVKKGVPIVCGIRDNSLQLICQKWAKLNDTIAIFPQYEKLAIEKSDIDSSIFSYREWNQITLSLIGYHQIDNALVVMEAFDVLQKFFEKTDYKVKLTKMDLVKGLSDVTWIGRMEKISDHPLILIDGGHNIDGIRSICEFVKSLPYRSKRAVVAISHDKELKDMIAFIDETFTEIIFTQYTYARSAKAIDLYQISQSSHKKYNENLEEVIDEVYHSQADITIFLGSLYLVGEVRNLIGNKSYKK